MLGVCICESICLQSPENIPWGWIYRWLWTTQLESWVLCKSRCVLLTTHPFRPPLSVSLSLSALSLSCPLSTIHLHPSFTALSPFLLLKNFSCQESFKISSDWCRKLKSWMSRIINWGPENQGSLLNSAPNALWSWVSYSISLSCYLLWYDIITSWWCHQVQVSRLKWKCWGDRDSSLSNCFVLVFGQMIM